MALYIVSYGPMGRGWPCRGLCCTYHYSTSSGVWQDREEVSMIAASWKDPTKIPQGRTRSVNNTHPRWHISFQWATNCQWRAHTHAHTFSQPFPPPPNHSFHTVSHIHTHNTLYNWLWKDIGLITLFPWGRRDPVTVRRKTKQRDGKIEQNKGRSRDSRGVIRINGGEMKGSWDRGYYLSFNIAGKSPPFFPWLRGRQVWVIF